MPETSEALRALPPYPLAGIPELKRRLIEDGVDLIDLGAGDAVLLPPPAAREALAAAVEDPSMSRYGFQLGLPSFREAIARFMERRFQVTLDPYRDLLPLIGSKEGIAHLPMAFLNPGDGAIIPDPGYQAYEGGALLAGGTVIRLPLRAENAFLMDLEEIPEARLAGAKILYMNYPNNPTTAVAPASYLADVVEFCRAHDLLLAFDNAYSEVAFDGYAPPSILEIPGAKDVALEFHSLSKTYNMTGWRIGWVSGNPEHIASLSKVKTFVDTGSFQALQAAGAAALEDGSPWVADNVARFQSRRDAVMAGLTKGGWTLEAPRATMYVWVSVPNSDSSADYCRKVLEQTGVVVLPGSALGSAGEGFFRIALTQEEDRLTEAVARLSTVA